MPVDILGKLIFLGTEINMNTIKTTQERPALQKEPDHSSEENEFDSYTDSEIDQESSDYKNRVKKLNKPKPNYITTSEIQSIERETLPQKLRSTPTRTISRTEKSSANPQSSGIAPIQPIIERRTSVQTIANDDKTALSLRLELNLDIEIELKAKIRGDLTLSLLLVFSSTFLETCHIKDIQQLIGDVMENERSNVPI